ncbi:hypothetical protein KI387_004877, partial [Taxus chinensis]
PTIWAILKLKSTKDYSAMPYVCTLFNCSLWLLYGMPFVKPHSTLILTVNGTGFALELFYLTIFLRFASKEIKVKTMKIFLPMAIIYTTLVVIAMTAMKTYRARQLLAGTASVLVSIAMYASPLSVMGLVIRTKSVEYMPLLLSVFNLMNAIVWASYSLVPSGVGCLLAIVQLTVYAMYRNSKQENPNTKEENQMVQLTEFSPARGFWYYKIDDENSEFSPARGFWYWKID